MPRVTIYSLAAYLGLSSSTVSRAYSRPEMVRPDVLERILAAGAELGYRTHRPARSLATGKNGSFGLLVPDITNPFFPPLVREIQLAAAAFDATILLANADSQANAEADLIQRLSSQTDGILLAAPHSPTSTILAALDGLPAVAVNRKITGLPAVVCDNTLGLRAAGEHLQALGHQRIALAAGPATSWAARQRSGVIRRWAADQDDVQLIEIGEFEASYEGGVAAAAQLSQSSATAAFVFDDLTAYGVVAGMAERGLTVPDDLSLVGCDDVTLSRVFTPSLTTVAAPFSQLGQAAVNSLDGLINGTSTRQLIRLTGELVTRRSTAAARS